MTPATALLIGALGGGAEVSLTLLVAKALDHRAARMGLYSRTSDLGPVPAQAYALAEPEPAEAPATVRALPVKLPGLTTSQVHELTGWSDTTIKRYEAAGLLTARRNHVGHRRFDEAEVRAAMNGAAS